tara:strand:+ start:1093 stop:1296 length:204 start_codon:yes stop_codon:yes gene_type:complete
MMGKRYYMVDVESYIFDGVFEDGDYVPEEEYQRLKNSNRAEQKLWLIKQVVEENIGIADFIEEESDE